MLLISDVLRLAAKGLTERRTRALLTIIGIAIGPLALVMLSSVVQGYSNYVISQIESLGQKLIVVFPSSGFKLTESDLDYIRSIPGVVRAEPFYATRGTLKIGGEEKEVNIYALPLDMLFEAIGSLEVREGKVPHSAEIVKAVVGYNIAFDEEGRRRVEVGDVITITVYTVKSGGKVSVKRVAVQVSAILDKYGGALVLNPDDTIFLNLDAGKRLLGMKDWSGILVLVKDSTLVDPVSKRIQSVYRNSVSIISFAAIAKIAASITGAMNFITFAASLSAFAVAVAGTAATMITSVIERTREIGVMKAIGFTDTDILVLILAESILMSLLGGAIGISLGVLGAYILAERGFVISVGSSNIVIKAPPLITPELIGRTLAITVSVGVFGGVFPAYRAAKIPPAVALRYE